MIQFMKCRFARKWNILFTPLTGSGQNRQPKYVDQEAFTLVELMISILVLSLMMSLAAVALRSLVDSLGRLQEPYPEKTVRVLRLQGMFASLYPYVAVKAAGAAGTFGAAGDTASFYFVAGDDECRFVTQSSYSKTGFNVVRIYRRDDAVVVDELPLYEGGVDYLSPALPDTDNPSVLFAKVAGLKFYYRYKIIDNEKPWSKFPSEISMELQYRDGHSEEYFFTVKSFYYEKMQSFLLLNQDV